MGDMVEVTTDSKNATSVYKVMTNCLTIEIRASGNAAIGFTGNPKIKGCKFWIVLGDHNQTSHIKQVGASKKVVQTPNLLTVDDYKKFWIRWARDKLMIGNYEDSTVPFLCMNTSDLSLSYFTLCSYSSRNPVFWRFERPPPKICTPPLIPLDGGGPAWVLHRAGAPLPADAVVGGHDGAGYLYVIRAPHQGSLTPGQYRDGAPHAYISWGMSAHEKKEFEILTGVNFAWVASSGAAVPAGAPVAGRSEVRRERLYAGRAAVQGSALPGKVQPSHRCCYVAWEGREVPRTEFEVLVEPHAPAGATDAGAGSDTDW